MNEVTTADSVILRGFHLNKQNEVTNLVKTLRLSPALNFKFNGNDIPDSSIIKTNQAAAEEGYYAAPFELLIPLNNQIQVK
jgi:hypothetical protein